MKPMNQNSLRNILEGNFGKEKIEDEDYFDLIQVLSFLANQDFNNYLSEIVEILQNDKSHCLVPFALAVGTLKTDISLNNSYQSSKLITVLSFLEVKQLLECTEIIKSKILGKGLGSSVQKIIKKSMENWNYNRLEENLVLHYTETYDLLRLIHPNFKGSKGTLIQKYLKYHRIN